MGIEMAMAKWMTVCDAERRKFVLVGEPMARAYGEVAALKQRIDELVEEKAQTLAKQQRQEASKPRRDDSKLNQQIAELIAQNERLSQENKNLMDELRRLRNRGGGGNNAENEDLK